MEAQELLILSGRFIGYLPEHAGERRAAEGRMRAIRPQDWTLASACFAMWDDARGPLTEMRAFVRRLRAAQAGAEAGRRLRATGSSLRRSSSPPR